MQSLGQRQTSRNLKASYENLKAVRTVLSAPILLAFLSEQPAASAGLLQKTKLNDLRYLNTGNDLRNH